MQSEAVRYYDAIARDYDQMVAGEWRIRKAFHQLVYRSVSRGSLVLDFGCGTGMDAAAYADHGYRVLAWDPSQRMRAETSIRCGKYVRSGRVTVLSSNRPELREAVPAAITANFAVTSLIHDLEPQFREWAQCLGVGGLLLLSIQNAWFLEDMKQRWWWRGLPLLLSRGEYRVHGSQVYRRSTSFVSKAALPYFEEESQTFHPWSKYSFLVYRRCQA